MNYLQIKELTNDLLTEIAQLRFYRTHLIDQLSPVLKNVIVLKGLRGVGKTTALLQFLYQHKDQNVLYLPANSTLLGSDRLIDISKEFNSRGGGILVIDEIHKYPDWEIEVLDIVNFHSNIRLIISASSTLQIDHHLADLSRRHVMLNAFGLSFREWSEKNFGISLPVVTIDELRNNIEEVTFSVQKAFKVEKIAINEQFSIYLREGYFPTRDNYPSLILYNQSIRNSVNAVIDQDIASRFRESTDLTHQNIKRLLSQIAKQCPFTPKMSTLRVALQLGDDKTVKRYLFMLHEAQVLNNLYPADRTYKDIPRPFKIYMENCNFMYALQDEVDKGNLRETFAASVLSKMGVLSAPEKGDLVLDEKYIFEVGGAKKTKAQIKKEKEPIVLNDGIDFGKQGHWPLWVLGFLW